MEKNRDVLVLGGGIAGMQSALLLAEKSRRVFVMDKAPAIGGYFPLLDRQFPTNSCGVCFMSPKPPALCPIYEGAWNPAIELLTNCDVDKIDGTAGDFTVAYSRRPTFVNADKCTLCGKCTAVCPVSVKSEFGEGLEERKAIYLPFPQAVPRSYVIDKKTCTECGKCVAACPAGAIDLKAAPAQGTVKVGAVILGFGFEPFQAGAKGEFGHGRYPNVLTTTQFERMLSCSSPTGGMPRRVSDGKTPRRIAFIECVGSRDRTCGNEYCSSVCCMFSAKQATVAKARAAGLEATIFYMDVRSFGKDYEAYYNRAQQNGVKYVRCAVSMIREQKQNNDLLLTYGLEDGTLQIDEFDMVILATGLTPPAAIRETAGKIGIELNEYGFGRTEEFTPTRTSRDGIFIAGAFREPRDIPESVVEACSAASDAAALLDDFDKRGAAAVPADLDGAGLRIGIFLCDDRGRLAAGLDMAVLKSTCSGQANVVCVETVDVTAPAKACEAVRAAAQKAGANRIILAGYKGLELERRLTQDDAYTDHVVSVNIGEQCADVHAGDKPAAQAKALVLIKAAVEAAWAVNPKLRARRDLLPGVLVVGGGITGMSAALALADQSIPVTLVEKETALGGLGRTAYYTVKGSDIQAHLKDLTARVTDNPKIEVLTGAELKKLSGTCGAFTATIGQNGADRDVKHGALILATGGKEHKPREYGYGRSQRVVTQRELDRRIADGDAAVKGLKTVVMIQCVGSRDAEHPYCSRVCCTHAVKNVLKLKELNPGADIFVLYRDVRTYGFFEKYYLAARDKGAIFVRYEPETKPMVDAGAESIKVSFYDHVAKEKICLNADLLVLSAGVEPSDVTGLSAAAGVALNDDGFYKEVNPKAAPLDARDRGKFIAGVGAAPMLIEEALCQGKAAAERAAALLWPRTELLPETQAAVKELVCTGCGQCVKVCPFGAIALNPQNGIAVVDTGLCRGCGTCAGTCRVQAIDIAGQGDLQLVNMLTTL